ncbi:MAG: CBS domain-containing protein [Oscillospiraceae bacterium]|nr:CBS domain-containing protein [Oscillospiraceae bacterium]
MLISELMTKNPVSMRPEEHADLAARLLERGNIGALPVCGQDGAPVGMVTDRDLVTRCMAKGKRPEEVPVKQIMSSRLVTVEETATVEEALGMMGKHQVRRIPVTSQGKLTGIVSLGDLIRARQEKSPEALRQVSENISRR